MHELGFDTFLFPRSRLSRRDRRSQSPASHALHRIASCTQRIVTRDIRWFFRLRRKGKRITDARTPATLPLKVLCLQQFKTYLAIEVFGWLPACYLACYMFQPTVRIVQTRVGSQAVQRTSELLQRYAPSWHESVAKLSARVYGSPTGRTTAEWLLVNKLAAPISFPTKLWIAHRIVERSRVRDAADAARDM